MCSQTAAQRLSAPNQPIYGLAAYDRAVALYYEGAYGDSVTSFHHLLYMQPHMGGFDRRYAALWMRHAGACAGYHADWARAGIPEPPRLDPLCGAAALASSLQALGRPFDQKTVLAAVPVTGEGSNLQDVQEGARKLGLNAVMLKADDQGLIDLPKPLVAYVEHDHFISVIQADKKGVSYLCSDCGMWPGGRVDLTWSQWHLLDGGLYLAASIPGSDTDKLLSALNGRARSATPIDSSQKISSSATNGVRVADIGSLSDLNLSLHTAASLTSNLSLDLSLASRLALLKGHVILGFNPVTGAYCGSKASALQCLECLQCCISSGGGPGPSVSI